MSFKTFKFTLDLHTHRSQVSIPAFCFDTDIRLIISITDGGVPYKLENGCIALLSGLKSNGTPFMHSCQIVNNTKIVYDFHKNTANVEGTTDCQIDLYGPDGGTLGSPKFIIVVSAKVLSDTPIENEEFETQFEALNNILIAEQGRVAAENEREAAEENRNHIFEKALDEIDERYDALEALTIGQIAELENLLGGDVSV